CFFYMIARTWRQVQLHGHDSLAAALIPRILELQDQTGDFGGPLSDGLALAALLDLGYRGSAADRAAAALLGRRQAGGRWNYEDFFIQGFGSQVWTTALAIAVLARYQVAGH